MTNIYIRHAVKDYRNSDAEFFKHDPGIKEFGVERAKKIATKLIETYGEPTKIVASPYRRTRETAMIMNTMLKNPFEEIFINTNLSEYLGNHAHAPIDVTSATKIHNPPHPESFDDMKKRVKKFMDKNEKSKEIVWFITHGIIIKQIASNLGIRTSKQFPYLTCFAVTEKTDMIRGEFLLFKGELKHGKESESPVIGKKQPYIQESMNRSRSWIFSRSKYNRRDDINYRK
jgi:broad specificity phosphatase PhoE